VLGEGVPGALDAGARDGAEALRLRRDLQGLCQCADRVRASPAVLAATDRIAHVAFAGIPIGLVLTLAHLVGMPIDNLSVNPARSLGPALFVGGWALAQLWLFIVAPLVGAVAAAALHYTLVAGESPIDPRESRPD
jgi:hypothetical protein